MPHGEPSGRKSQILFLDAYDSFSNNIIALLESETSAKISVLKIDDSSHLTSTLDEFECFLQHFDAVVAGPGPGNPTNPHDVGLIGWLWTIKAEIPVLGICLGFQSLSYAYGARVERLNEPRHGIVQRIVHSGDSIFHGVGQALVTQYHSLCIRLGQEAESDEPDCDQNALWSASQTCPDLIPLAWSLEDVANGPTLMGVRHRSKPLWGIQFHPESVCTNESGKNIIKAWWSDACQCNQKQRRLLRDVRLEARMGQREEVPGIPGHIASTPGEHCQLVWRELDLKDLEVCDICEAFGAADNKVILLESGKIATGRLVNSETGRFSIIGIPDSEVEQFQYFSKAQILVVHQPAECRRVEYQMSLSDVWVTLSRTLQSRKVKTGPACSPFWGGLIGFVSYEACLETIEVQFEDTNGKPDMWFVDIRRSIVIDHLEDRVYIQSLRENDSSWIAVVEKHFVSLQKSPRKISRNGQARDASEAQNMIVSGPTKADYCASVRACQEHIRAGSSYELCLTAQTKVLFPNCSTLPDPWDMYSTLRLMNPAPFSAFLHLSDASQAVSIVSSSPERFLSWTRSGKCQYRPIKGTVSRSIPGMTLDKAQAILQSPKERAENLMIVDLVRHDLHGVVGAGNVQVAKLMVVEEYETVYQLVSVIEGQLPSTRANHHAKPENLPTGIDVLAASLPPGSMTGAPKRRSCELLQEIETHKPRGIYSGVLGYLDVGGGGDFSVVIRTAYRWETDLDDVSNAPFWKVGAGGAVTSQSSDEAEWEEMCIKRSVLLKAFGI